MKASYVRAPVGTVAVLAVLGSGFGCGGTTTVETPTSTAQKSAPEARVIDAPLPIDAGARPDSGVCPPSSVDYRVGSWMPHKPPRVALDACAAGQTLAILTPCELGVGSCGDFAVDLAPCVYCLYARENDATYGLRTGVGPGDDRLNVRGYALLVGATEACAESLEDYAGCMDLACACSSSARKASCLGKARAGACAALSEAVTLSCSSSGTSTAGAKFLRPIIEAGTFPTEAAAVTMAKAFCGGS